MEINCQLNFKIWNLRKFRNNRNTREDIYSFEEFRICRRLEKAPSIVIIKILIILNLNNSRVEVAADTRHRVGSCRFYCEYPVTKMR